MSDSKTSAEIEDVLSSIRRLVSSEDHLDSFLQEPEAGGAVEQKLSERAGSGPATLGRLLLTPALRVREAGAVRHDALSARVAEMEEVVARQKDQWEPEGANRGGPVAPLAWDEIDEGEEDAALPEEEALRELIADVVRQELQGALGERITHNMRKLVQREIQRALAAADL